MEPKIISGDCLVKKLTNYIHNEHLIVSSNIPDVCKTEPCLLGVDEAGRGPVLGPMVYGIAFCPLSKSEEFATLGCADSKVLTEQKREELFAIMCACEDYVGWSVDIISPNYISNNMLKRSKHSLNEVAQDSTVRLIQKAIDMGIQVSEIYVDTVGPPEKYQAKLSTFFPDCKITVAKKADSLFPIVSGASICAKVSRDRVINNWKYAEKIEDLPVSYGSGYPNDPETKKFMANNLDDIFGFPTIVRFSWSTASKILEEKAAIVEWEECEEATATPSMRNFLTSSIEKGRHTMKHTYFKDNGLRNVSSF